MIRLTLSSRNDLCLFLSKNFENIDSRISALVSTSIAPCSDHPSIDLGHDEIDGSFVDQVFAYAGIYKTNMPFGIAGDFDPVVVGESPRKQVLIFSVNRLEQHIAVNAANIYQEYMRCGDMDSYVAFAGNQMTAEQYFVGGLLECIRLVKNSGSALCISW